MKNNKSDATVQLFERRLVLEETVQKICSYGLGWVGI